jgi:hypothetical protein
MLHLMQRAALVENTFSSLTGMRQPRVNTVFNEQPEKKMSTQHLFLLGYSAAAFYNNNTLHCQCSIVLTWAPMVQQTRPVRHVYA